MKMKLKNPYAIGGWVLILGGWAAGLAGWLGVQKTADIAVQLAYLASGGLSGIALVVVGAAMLNRDDTRALRVTIGELQRQLQELEDRLDTAAPAGDEPEREALTAEQR